MMVCLPFRLLVGLRSLRLSGRKMEMAETHLAGLGMFVRAAFGKACQSRGHEAPLGACKAREPARFTQTII
jgi:hypothetical protein